ncbi:hypothetical protein ACUOAQ_11435, partial [Escherichia sp. SP-MK]
MLESKPIIIPRLYGSHGLVSQSSTVITPQAALATHFPAGLPVVCTTSDKPVEALGAGLLDDETAVISLGTYIALMMNGK